MRLTLSQDYRELRADQYPELADQLDMLWHSMDSGQIPKAEPFYSALKAVKEQYPKPQGTYPTPPQ